ncbi:MAG TPA: hypothetical protein VFQ79_09165 [Bryobacteraceae bacterium]|nr:hypothetical protein [Bryobacteraceae bacterium]
MSEASRGAARRGGLGVIKSEEREAQPNPVVKRAAHAAAKPHWRPRERHGVWEGREARSGRERRGPGESARVL